MTPPEGQNMLTRRLGTTDLDVDYTVATTADQVDAVSQGLTSVVKSNLSDHLTKAIASHPSLNNVTLQGITGFVDPVASVTSTTDVTDSDDGMSTTTIIVVCLCVGIPCLLVVIIFL